MIPDEYQPLNYCRGCGFDFTSLDAFDRHRSGSRRTSASSARRQGSCDTASVRRPQREAKRRQRAPAAPSPQGGRRVLRVERDLLSGPTAACA